MNQKQNQAQLAGVHPAARPDEKRVVLSVDYDEYNVASYRGITAYSHDSRTGEETKVRFPTIDDAAAYVREQGAAPLFSSSFDNFEADGGTLPRKN